jgi:hypothetical protein
MENIIEPSSDFDFSKLSLAQPTALNGGAYFTKILYNKEPIYIQTHKSKTKQGIVKTGKKYFCDLVFDNNSEQTINWFEKLEERCQQLLFEKTNDWFEGSLDKNDIDNAFNSILKIYKSGKYYLLKTNIKNIQPGDAPAIKVYNENETVLSYDTITVDTEIISIIEIQGIKFTTRSFQIEISLKQIMVLDNEPIFENCIIKATKHTNKSVPTNNSLEEKREKDNPELLESATLEEIENTVSNKNIENIENVENTEEKELLPIAMPIDLITNTSDNTKEKDTVLDSSINDDISSKLNLDIEELPTTIIEDNSLKELDISSDNNYEEPLQLKKPNQVYLELYREARSKAKIAKKNAILAYLEAKNIKKTFMIENINDNSDSDFDDEIEEVSESELENL